MLFLKRLFGVRVAFDEELFGLYWTWPLEWIDCWVWSRLELSISGDVADATLAAVADAGN